MFYMLVAFKSYKYFNFYIFTIFSSNYHSFFIIKYTHWLYNINFLYKFVFKTFFDNNKLKNYIFIIRELYFQLINCTKCKTWIWYFLKERMKKTWKRKKKSVLHTPFNKHFLIFFIFDWFLEYLAFITFG